MSRTLLALIWLDVQVLRIVTFGRSRPGETISAAAWALEADSKWQGRLGNGSDIFIKRSSSDGSNDKTRA